MSTAIQTTATFDSYLRKYGPTLGRKAIQSLSPLHNHATDAAPDFRYVAEHNPNRVPFDPQAHVIAGASKMLDHVGNGFIVGEMGTGKTLMGMLAIHENAKGTPYRAMVLCPDHLITTWVQEIEETIPGAKVITFENWKAFIELFSKGHQYRHDVTTETGTISRLRKKWLKPERAEWYILGRNQSKFEPEVIGVGSEHRGYSEPGSPGKLAKNRGVVSRVVGHKPLTDADKRPIIDVRTGEQRMEPIIDKRVLCPSCGMVVLGPKNIPASAAMIAEKRMTCSGHFLQARPQVREGQDGKFRSDSGTDRLPGEDQYRKKVGKAVKIGHLTYDVVACNEPLWNFTRKPNRYPPATIMQRKLRGFIKYLVIDEVHEQKSDESAQSMAAGKLMGISKHVLALTGTLIGGYAEHLFPLLLRMTGRSILAERFKWGCKMEWSQQYGRVDRIVTTRQEPGEVSQGRGQVSMRKARTGRTEERQVVRPGVMPTLYGRHMLGSSIFIMLEELSDELPDMNEYVGGKIMAPSAVRPALPTESPEDYEDYKRSEVARYDEYKSGYFDTAVDMDDELADEYRRIERDLVATNQDLMRRGCMKLLGTMLWTLLDYPDMPYGWRGEHPDAETVGYYEITGNKSIESYRGVTSPADLGESIRPKEQRLIDICKQQKAEKRQSWVYVNMTGKRNVQPRLKKLLEAEGLSVCILKSNTVKPIDRKDWIDENGPKYDVIISNPTLVATGLTLFSKKDGGHNFSTLIFYETGYNLFTLRQAARRAWRIGQPFNCRVYYLYYNETMQQRAMNLMSKKMAAAAALEGEFSAEGLIGMSGDDSAQMSLARSLKDSINDSDANRGWTKLKARTKPKKGAIAASTTTASMMSPPSDTEQLSDAIELIGQTMIDHGSTPSEVNKMIATASEPVAAAKATPLALVGDPQPKRTKKIRADGPQDSIEAIKARFAPRTEKPTLEIHDEADGTPKMPAITREQLAKMFANMKANGMSIDDFR